MINQRTGHSIEELRKVLEFVPELGRFRWLVGCIRTPKGAIAGTLKKDSGYRQIQWDKKLYREHVLIWAFVYGEWPNKHVDHIDGDEMNNRPENLRLASVSQNIANSKLNRRSSSGLKGVSRKGKRWKAAITHNYKALHLGTFDTPEQAHAAYQAAAKRIFGEFARVA